MEPAPVKPIPIFFLSLVIIFAIITGFFLRQRQKTPQKPPPVTVEKIYSPEETAKRILSGSVSVGPSADLTHCPTLPSNTFQIISTRTESTGALSYVTIGSSSPDRQHFYQLILLASPPPWKLVACRDLGTPVLLQTR